MIPVGKESFVRKPPKRVDFLLRYTRDFPLAVVEAKASYKTAADAVQQARLYAEMLGLKFAYATNGKDIIEIDYFTGTETPVSDFSRPEELWQRYQTGSGITKPQQADQLIAAYNMIGGKPPGTTSKSPSTARSRPSLLENIVFSLLWRRAPAKPSSPFKSAGSSGRADGTGRRVSQAPHPLSCRPQHSCR